MTKLLLSLHVLTVIVAVGPVTVAASMFPATARRALTDPADTRHAASLRTLHRICRVYATLAIAVPVFGFATASSLGVLGDAWLIAAIMLTALAAGILALAVLPRQDRLLATVTRTEAPGGDRSATAQLAMYTGMFNLLWAAVTVLMIVRPGSTTGV